MHTVHLNPYIGMNQKFWLDCSCRILRNRLWKPRDDYNLCHHCHALCIQHAIPMPFFLHLKVAVQLTSKVTSWSNILTTPAAMRPTTRLIPRATQPGGPAAPNMPKAPRASAANALQPNHDENKMLPRLSLLVAKTHYFTTASQPCMLVNGPNPLATSNSLMIE